MLMILLVTHSKIERGCYALCPNRDRRISCHWMCSRKLWFCSIIISFFFFNDTATTEIYTLSLHDALPIWLREVVDDGSTGFLVPAKDDAALAGHILRLAADANLRRRMGMAGRERAKRHFDERSEEHTSELQSRLHLVCRLLLEKKKKIQKT